MKKLNILASALLKRFEAMNSKIINGYFIILILL